MNRLFAVVGFAALLAGCSTRPQHSRAWEYKTVTGSVFGSQPSVSSAINRDVALGWEFVSSGGAADQWGFAVLRREKK